MILLVSHDKDAHTIAVQQELANAGHPFDLLDLSHFPSALNLSLQYNADGYAESILHWPDKERAFSEYGAIWWRRPQPFALHEEIQGNVERHFTYTECQCAVSGLLMLTNAFWMNHPVKDEVASRKAYQLKVAAACGLTIPRTLVSNDPQRVRDFINELGVGNVIYKPFSATEQAWRETRLVRKEELEKLDSVKYSPVIFQECIHADIDLRITIIGDQIFPAAIHSQDTSYKYDFRMNYHEAKIEPHPLPEAITQRLHRFMQEMGLVYGAVDMRMRPTGEYVFLEVNTAGQWLFMQEPTGMPITQALARTLIENDLEHSQQKAVKENGKRISLAAL